MSNNIFKYRVWNRNKPINFLPLSISAAKPEFHSTYSRKAGRNHPCIFPLMDHADFWFGFSCNESGVSLSAAVLQLVSWSPQTSSPSFHIQNTILTDPEPKSHAGLNSECMNPLKTAQCHLKGEIFHVSLDTFILQSSYLCTVLT